MDTEQLITHGRARFEHAAARRLLREKYQAKLTFAHAGGMWRAGPELIAVLQACPDESAVIADLYDAPIKIQVSDLLMLVQQRWQEQMWAWLIEYDQLSKNR
jgi:hypothetical protein